MPKVIYIEHNGDKREIDGSAGESVMLTAVSQGIESIVGECGGACACATCHCYVEGEWVARAGEADPIESAMLEMTAAPRQPNSRLSCQIELSEDLDGLVIRLPEVQ